MKDLRHESEIIADMKKANAEKNVERVRQLIIEAFYPDADTLIELCKKDLTTQDGYGSAMSFLLKFPKNYRPMFIRAMVDRGYPEGTAKSLSNLVNA